MANPTKPSQTSLVALDLGNSNTVYQTWPPQPTQLSSWTMDTHHNTNPIHPISQMVYKITNGRTQQYPLQWTVQHYTYYPPPVHQTNQPTPNNIALHPVTPEFLKQGFHISNSHTLIPSFSPPTTNWPHHTPLSKKIQSLLLIHSTQLQCNTTKTENYLADCLTNQTAPIKIISEHLPECTKEKCFSLDNSDQPNQTMEWLWNSTRDPKWCPFWPSRKFWTPYSLDIFGKIPDSHTSKPSSQQQPHQRILQQPRSNPASLVSSRMTFSQPKRYPNQWLGPDNKIHNNPVHTNPNNITSHQRTSRRETTNHQFLSWGSTQHNLQQKSTGSFGKSPGQLIPPSHTTSFLPASKDKKANHCLTIPRIPMQSHSITHLPQVPTPEIPMEPMHHTYNRWRIIKYTMCNFHPKTDLEFKRWYMSGPQPEYPLEIPQPSPLTPSAPLAGYTQKHPPTYTNATTPPGTKSIRPYNSS